jgi:Zn-dependent protease with chaperone function
MHRNQNYWNSPRGNPMRKIAITIRVCLVGIILIFISGCLGLEGFPSAPASTPAPAPAPTGTTAGAKVDPAQVARLKRLMLPLARVMNNPIPSGQIQVGVVDDPQINAGSAGSGQFIVTTGLLNKANDQQLQSILAHEMAHDDLGHSAKAQAMGTGLNIATVLLDQIFPGSGQFTPIAGNLAIRAYGRNEEYAADQHGVALLRKINLDGKSMMVSTLTWLQQTTGGSEGGFFATHPGTPDRIDRVRNLP